MATEYFFTIEMDSETLEKLDQGGFQLYGFKGVKTSQGGGQLPVWFSSNNFAKEMTVTWKEEYGSYITSSDIQPGVTIVAESQVDMNLGELATVSGYGDMSVSTDGVSDAISLVTQQDDTKEWTCGMSQSVNGEMTPLCAFPLYGSGNMDVFIPIERILLFFGTGPVNTGNLIYYSLGPSIKVEYSGETSASASYNINSGWDVGTATNMSTYPAESDIAGLLIENEPDLTIKAALQMKQLLER